MKLFFLFLIPFLAHASELDHLIGPEIKNDKFYRAITQLARTENVSTILEIGSSSGEGSTEAFVTGLKENPHHPTLFCMEVSKARFSALKQRYKEVPAVKCYNVSSVPLTAFPTESDVTAFYNTIKTSLNGIPLERVLGWLKQDIEYVKTADVPQNGIELIKKENGITTFDIVLIDGSEFTGMAELKLVYGARFILLDDIKTFKNHHNFERLSKDPNYTCVKKHRGLRNGFAIFKKNS